MTSSDVSEASPSVLLPISEAASRLRLHPAALRSRIRRGSVTARRGNAGQLLVAVPADAKPASDEAQPASDGEEPAFEIDFLRRELEAARLAMAKVEGERDTALAKLTAERDAATALAVAKVDAAERVIAELRTMLEDARRPWWRKWMAKP